jgi:two-component system sensor histidine kinase VicK
MQNISTEIFEQIGQSSADAYFIFDVVNQKFTYISQAFQNIWGQPVEKFSNDPDLALKFIDPEDHTYVKTCYENFLNNNRKPEYEFRILCGDDGKKFIRLKAYPIFDNGAIVSIAGIAEDASIVRRNILYAEKINARKNSMLEIVVHDLKGPIGMINMMASSMQRDALKSGNQGILDAVTFIQDMCKRNIALIRDLTTQEYIESTEMALRKERADLVWEINDVIQNYKRSEGNISKTFVFTSTHDKLYIHLDSLKFMQAINNLISNAIKFTPDNGVIEVDLKDQEDTVLITIKDDGIGIPQDVQPFLFDKFTRARRTGLRGEEPVGLGMSIIKTLVELHEGHIWFNSEENKGSTFYVEIPKQ